MSTTQLPEDPSALSKIGRLDFVAKQIVNGYMMGQHKSAYKGNSVEFVEHRQYTPGDEIKHIDWRAFGKTGRYYIKEFEEETNLRCYLLMDASGSMNYGQSTLTKFEYARYVVASLGYLLLRQRDAVGLQVFDTKLHDLIPASVNPQQFQRLIHTLETLTPGGEASLGKLTRQFIRKIPRRCMVVLVSDAFDDIDQLTESLQMLRHAGHEVVLMQTLAPEEMDFPFTKPTKFESLEVEEPLLVDPLQLRAVYTEEFTAFQEQLNDATKRAGIDYLTFSTTDSIAQTLGAFIASRSRRT